MPNETRHRQTGMTLIEVLVSVLILAIGLLGPPLSSLMPSNTPTVRP